MKKPTIEEIQKYINIHDPLELKGVQVRIVSKHNHLIYRLEKDGRVYALRMINPESYRAREWISMVEEYKLLKALEPTGLGPKVFLVDEEFSPPFLIQELVEATCFNDLKPFSEEHLRSTAYAIAELNSQAITPERFPFMNQYREKGYQKRELVWYFRLLETLRRTMTKDVLRWVVNIYPIVKQTANILSGFEKLLPKKWSFHFDGAHCGNTYWRDGKVIFLDWQSISYRNDPTFTLVRFATSAGPAKGIVPESLLKTLIDVYLEARPIPNFVEMARARLFERQVSDLVWVLWDYSRRGDKRPVEEATSVVSRYNAVKKMLKNY